MIIKKLNRKGVKSFAPASVANVNCGYDILGFAIHGWGDEVIAQFDDVPGIRIRSIHGDGGLLPKEAEKNTASYAAMLLLEHLGESRTGVVLDIYKRMPFSSGLGSSAASAVAGVVAVNGLFGNPLSKEALLPFAIQAEQMADGAWHADNIAPSLLGGLVLVQSANPPKVSRVPVPRGMLAVVVHPDMQIYTKESRELVDPKVPIADHVIQSANLGSLIIGMYNSDFGLIASAMKDIIVEPRRMHLIPGFEQMKSRVIEAGALGFGISGAGPSVFALCNNTMIAEEVLAIITGVFKENGIDSTSSSAEMNFKGAFLY